MKKNRTPAFLFLLITAVLLLLVACENALQTYVLESLFGSGWRISSWSSPEKVLPTEDYDSLSNGFPQQIGIAADGSIHVVVYGVHDFAWLYTVRQPGDTAFPDAYGVAATGIYSLTTPAMVLLLNDLPVIAYGDRNGSGPDYNLCYQEKQTGNPGDWGSQRILYTTTDTRINSVWMFFLTSETLKPHLFYLTEDNEIYHTVKTGSSTIAPDPPELFVATALQAAIFQIGSDDTGIVYSAGERSLYYTELRENDPVEIWSTADTDTAIASVAAAADEDDGIHIVFGTYNPDASFDPLYFKYNYLSNTNGEWEEHDTLDGTEDSGPAAFYAPAMLMTRDSKGVNHLHMAYTEMTPLLTTSIRYCCFDAGSWQTMTDSLDPSRNAFYPSIAADDAGAVHILYSDYMSELDRELYYLKGSPEKPQD